ncbi:MAG: helix-turn-helix transcriptional regulator [Solirubrobacteraceae bacterium]
MNRVRTPITVKSIPGSRAETGRRLKAARMLADVSLRDAAQAAGLSYSHVSAIEHGREPLTSTDALDLGAVLGCPAGWLAHGWAVEGE